MSEAGFIYIETKPKFRCYEVVYQTMTAMAMLCHELYGGITDFKLRVDNSNRRKLTFQVVFNDLKDKEAFEQNQQFQDLLVDLRLASKRDRLLPYKQLVATRYQVLRSSRG